jgi:hypothetical protein
MIAIVTLDQPKKVRVLDPQSRLAHLRTELSRSVVTSTVVVQQCSLILISYARLEPIYSHHAKIIGHNKRKLYMSQVVLYRRGYLLCRDTNTSTNVLVTTVKLASKI